MRHGWAVAVVAGLAMARGALGVSVTLEPEGESVYAPPAPMTEEEGSNTGGVHVDVTVNYMTDYMYRGIEILEPTAPEDRPNLQFDDKLSFDLGKLPHPFVGFFLNVNDADSVSRFQELRPYLGADWTIAPFTLSFGNNTYIYPNRDKFNTSDVFGKLAFNDSFLWKTEKPVLSPYIYAAYDFNKYSGWYFEMGVSHDWVIEDTGITLTGVAEVAYVRSFELFALAPGHDTGFQHYQVGMVANYSLNALLNLPRRLGEWRWIAYVYYTDNLEADIKATTQVWGGTGIGFKY